MTSRPRRRLATLAAELPARGHHVAVDTAQFGRRRRGRGRRRWLSLRRGSYLRWRGRAGGKAVGPQGGQQLPQPLVVLLAKGDVLAHAPHRRDSPLADEEGKQAHLVLVLQGDGVVALVAHPLGIGRVGGDDQHEDAARLQTALDGVNPLLARLNALRGHPDIEPVVAQIVGQLPGEGGVLVGVAQEDAVGVAPGGLVGRLALGDEAELLLVGCRPQFAQGDQQVIRQAAALAIADQGDDLLALGHPGGELVQQIGVVVEAQFIQLQIAEVLGDELSEFGFVDHRRLSWLGPARLIHSCRTPLK